MPIIVAAIRAAILCWAITAFAADCTQDSDTTKTRLVREIVIPLERT